METPFYMTYPLQTVYDTELAYEKDVERMKTYYPGSVRRVQNTVEDYCDELEYEGSRIYDEEPDKYMLGRDVDAICARIGAGEAEPGQDLKNTVAVLFYQEVYRRRCRYRRCHRWW